MSAIEPGLHHDLPNNDYHAETGWLSSTLLKSYLPERYRAGGSQEALDFGSLFHTVVLEPDRVALDYVALNAETVGVKADGTKADNPTATKAWKEAVAAAEASGKTVISQTDLDRAYAMRKALLEHQEAAQLLFGEGTSEVSAFAVDEDGSQHKARFDRLAPGAIVDLKSTAAKPGATSLTRAVLDYGYDLQVAHYLAVANMLGLDAPAFTLVFVSKEAPHRVTVCDLDELFIERGRTLRALAIERAHKRIEPYEGATGRLTLLCPDWALPYDDEIEVA